MYNVDSLKQGIIKCGENIKMFQSAIQKEQDTIAEYEGYIKAIKDQAEFDAKKNIEIRAERE